MQNQHIPAETVAEAYLALLKDRGITRLFVNSGTDFASIVEAYGRLKESGLDFPEVFVCAHENLAISMAHGSYLGDGAPQAVMLHTSVGTANSICGVFSAARARVPVLLTAGRTPLFEHDVPGSRDAGIHWAQEMFDQAGMLRELVKWDYELRDGVQVEEVVDRALDIALTEPRGPVYLSLPREVLAAEVSGIQVREQASAVPTGSYPDPEAVGKLADLLARAAFPVIVTSSTGADPSTVTALSELCRRYSIAVLENNPRYVNVPADHPLHVGYAAAPVLAEADVICAIDVDVPWTPAQASPRPDAVVVQCGPDPHFSSYPIRSHHSDLSITATSGHLLTALEAALAERADSIDAQRYERLAGVAGQWRTEREGTLADEATKQGPITKAFMNWALREVCPTDAIVVNEYWCSAGQLGRTEPGTYFGTPPAGALGWGLPTALGVQLARRDRVVIATLGDGAYMFANPAAGHQAMAMHDLPVLTIICGNSKWGAVESSALGMYPDGHAAGAGELSPLARLDPVPAFEKYAEASGGYGERVTERGELVAALQRGLQVVQKERRHALINVMCA